MKMRFVGVCSSPKKDRTTATIVRTSLEAIEKKIHELDPDVEIDIQYVSLAGKTIKPCIDCGACKRKGSLCVVKDDWLDCVDPLIDPDAPDGVIFGSPVYYHSTNSQMRAFMERFTCLFKQIWHKEHPIPALDFTKTVAGAVCVGQHRNGGVEEAVQNIISFFCSCGFIVVNSFNMEQGPVGYTGGTGWSESPGVNYVDITQDEWGMDSAKIVGYRVAETAYLLRKGRESLS